MLTSVALIVELSAILTALNYLKYTWFADLKSLNKYKQIKTVIML